MALTYRHSGDHEDVATASAAITSGACVWQEGIFGIAIKSAAIGASLAVDTHGVHLCTVPSGTVKGDRIYATLAYGTDQAAVTLKRTGATGDTIVGIARGDRDATSGLGLVKLASQPFAPVIP